MMAVQTARPDKEMPMLQRAALALAVLTLAAIAGIAGIAGAADMAPADHPVFTPADINWAPVHSLPPGAKGAVLQGDPGKTGLYVLRLSLPDGYKIPPHYHPVVEHITVISGELHIGMGDTLDTTKGKAMPTGSFGYLPAQMHHYAWATGPTVIQIHGEGPLILTYVNPADDPTRAKQ
jgi:quercetin dioxygenase-like cupin family protein